MYRVVLSINRIPILIDEDEQEHIFNKNGEIIKIYDLGMLIKTIQPKIAFPETVKLSAISLTKFAATFRYPDYPDIDEELTKKALADMDVVVDWCKGQIEA